MRVNLSWDNVALIRRLEKGERRLAFAAVNALNNAAKDVQAAQQAALAQKFTVRTDFTRKQIAIINPFASVGKGRPYVEISIGRRPRSLLAQFEAGGLKEHRGKNVAVPVTGEEARPTFQTPQTYPPLVKRLKFRKPRRKKSAANKTVLRSTVGPYFLIPGEGIFRREGERAKLVIALVEEVRIPAKLGWLVRARTVGERALRERMEQEAINAIGRTGGR